MDELDLEELMLSVEVDREVDGRWIAEVLGLPGVLAYGEDREQAIAAAKSLAEQVLADPAMHKEVMDRELERRIERSEAGHSTPAHEVIAWLRARARSKG